MAGRTGWRWRIERNVVLGQRGRVIPRRRLKPTERGRRRTADLVRPSPRCARRRVGIRRVYGRVFESASDRATIGNMAPEYGATMGFFPIDAETIKYLRFTGRDEAQVQLVEAYTKAQGIFRTDDTPDPAFSDTIELDLRSVEPSLAGPKRPQDRVPLSCRRECSEMRWPRSRAHGHRGAVAARSMR